MNPPLEYLPSPALEGALQGAARRRLREYREAYGAQDSKAWLKHCTHAIELVRQTFPPERQESALRDYSRRYCEGQVAIVIAVHTISLELWAADDRRQYHGLWLEASCKACGLSIEGLPEDREGLPEVTSLRTSPPKKHEVPPKKHELPPEMRVLQRALVAGKLTGPLNLGYLKHPDVKVFTQKFLKTLERYGPKHSLGRAAKYNLMLVVGHHSLTPPA